MQPNQVDWQAQAKFWRLKYFELLSHNNQIIAQLSQPILQEAMADQLAMQLAMQHTEPTEQDVRA